MSWENDLINKIKPGVIQPASGPHGDGGFHNSPMHSKWVEHLNPDMPYIPSANDDVLPGVGLNENENKPHHMATYTNEITLNKIEAFIQGPISARPDVAPVRPTRPDHGQGDVHSKEDGRLKQNKDKKELEEQAEALENGAGDEQTDDEKHEEKEQNDVKSPYERERVDHRAGLYDMAPKVPAPNVPKVAPVGGPTLTHQMNNYTKPAAPPLSPLAPKPPMTPSIAPSMTSKPPIHPAIQKILNDPEHGPYASQLFGQNPSIDKLPAVMDKIKSRQMMAQTTEEKNELQKTACLIATVMLKYLK